MSIDGLAPWVPRYGPKSVETWIKLMGFDEIRIKNGWELMVLTYILVWYPGWCFLDGSTRTVSRGLMARCGSRAYGSLLLLLVASCSWFHDLLALDSWFDSMESRP